MNATEIINYLTNAAETRQILSAEDYLRAARTLVLLMGDEKDKLIELESKIANMTIDLKNENKDMPISEVKLRRDAWPEYRDMRKQKAFIEQIVEYIRLAKAGARLAEEEMRHQNMMGTGN
jgi:hypothetical protein